MNRGSTGHHSPEPNVNFLHHLPIPRTDWMTCRLTGTASTFWWACSGCWDLTDNSDRYEWPYDGPSNGNVWQNLSGNSQAREINIYIWISPHPGRQMLLLRMAVEMVGSFFESCTMSFVFDTFSCCFSMTISRRHTTSSIKTAPFFLSVRFCSEAHIRGVGERSGWDVLYFYIISLMKDLYF